MGADYKKRGGFLLQFYSDGNVAANSTVFISNASQSAGENAAELLAPADFEVYGIAVHCDNPPGGADTYVYHLREERVNTPVTITLTGGNSEGRDLTNSVVINGGNNYDIMLVTSATAAVGAHWIVLLCRVI